MSLIFYWPQIWTQQSHGHWRVFTYLLHISRLPDSPVFCGWLGALGNVSKPRGRQGFSESLLRLWSSVGLELRQSVFGVLKGGFNGMKRPQMKPRGSQKHRVRWRAWTSGRVNLDVMGVFVVELICVFFVCFPPQLILEDQEICKTRI